MIDMFLFLFVCFCLRILIDFSFKIIGLCSTYRTPDYGSVRVQNNHFHFPWPRIPNGVTRITFTVTNANRDVFIILSNSTAINDADSIPKIGKYKKYFNKIFAEIVLIENTCMYQYALQCTL